MENLNIHINNLKSICRVCGFKIKTSSHYKSAKSIKSFSSELHALIGYDSNEPQDIFPENLCQKCYLKIYQFMKRKLNDDNATTNIELFVFKPHSLSCLICLYPQRSGRPSSAKSSDEISFFKQIDDIFCLFSCTVFKGQLFRKCAFFSNVDIDSYPIVIKLLKLEPNGEWVLSLFQKEVSKHHPDLLKFPAILKPENCRELLTFLEKCNLCPGNNDFHDLISKKISNSSNFKSTNGQDIGIIESNDGCSINNLKTIRHTSCKLFLNDGERRCGPCVAYRVSLHVQESRRKSSIGKDINPFKNERYMTLDEALTKINILKKEKKQLTQQRLLKEKKIEQLLKKDSLSVNENLDNVLESVVSKTKDNPFEENSAMFVLWEQQKKQISISDKRGMRWHPLMIRWALSIYLKSPSAYRQIQQGQFLNLPCKNTLLKYVNFTNSGCGFNKDIISRLLTALDLKNMKEMEKNVSLIFDEMKIKDNLIFSKSSGKLVGFTEMGEINDTLKELEMRVNDTSSTQEESLAKYVIVFMVRGIFSKLCFPFGYFASEGFNSDQIYHCAWEAIGILESLNLKVRAIVADGASPNRRFMKLHKMKEAINEEHGVIYWTWNEACPGRKVFFICDVPHLIKTSRNNLENSHGHLKTRNLVLNKQEMGWHQILSVYDWDCGYKRDVIGLKFGHKLKDEHVNLNPNTRMRVYLAAQVLSMTVVNMLEEQGLASTASLQKFIRIMDKFFDCLNVSRCLNKTRKPELNPYRFENDVRFSWLQNDFIGFFREWLDEIGNSGVSKEAMQRMCLSPQTLEGLKTTALAFSTLGRILLQENPGCYLLSEKFSQDPVEEYFSKQRQRCGSNDNPTLQDFGRNFLGLHVAGDDLIRAVNGNTRGHIREDCALSIENTNLPPVKKQKR